MLPGSGSSSSTSGIISGRSGARRRSSGSEYVGMSDDIEIELDTEEAVILTTVARARNARSLKHKRVKSFNLVKQLSYI